MTRDIQAIFRDRKYVVTIHALNQLLERGIRLERVRQAMAYDRPEVIEDYPDDERGASCLILCFGPDDEPYHVHCSRPPKVYLVTAYVPDPERWSPDYRRRLLI